MLEYSVIAGLIGLVSIVGLKSVGSTAQQTTAIIAGELGGEVNGDDDWEDEDDGGGGSGNPWKEFDPSIYEDSYVDGDGVTHYVGQSYEPDGYDDNGDPYYYDDNGEQCYYDQNGARFYRDEDGNSFYRLDDGSQIPCGDVTASERPSAKAEVWTDENGHQYIEEIDENGNVYHQEQWTDEEGVLHIGEAYGDELFITHAIDPDGSRYTEAEGTDEKGDFYYMERLDADGEMLEYEYSAEDAYFSGEISDDGVRSDHVMTFGTGAERLSWTEDDVEYIEYLDSDGNYLGSHTKYTDADGKSYIEGDDFTDVSWEEYDDETGRDYTCTQTLDNSDGSVLYDTREWTQDDGCTYRETTYSDGSVEYEKTQYYNSGHSVTTFTDTEGNDTGRMISSTTTRDDGSEFTTTWDMDAEGNYYGSTITWTTDRGDHGADITYSYYHDYVTGVSSYCYYYDEEPVIQYLLDISNLPDDIDPGHYPPVDSWDEVITN